jgi:ketosteroid isomerase-like protein
MRVLRFCLPLVMVILIMAAACQQKGPAALSDADKAAIKKTAEQGLAMLTAPTRDNQAFVRFLYTDDAILLPPNAPAVTGGPAIVEYLKTFPAFADFKQETQEIVGFDDFAYDRETYSMTMLIPGAPADQLKDVGKVIWIWKKQPDGGWKLWREIFNSDLPAK